MTSAVQLCAQIRACWRSDTSSDPGGWSVSNPAWGQCAVTACVLHDVLGGRIVWCIARSPDNEEHSHYFNVLADGSTLDLTREQFPVGTVFAPENGRPKTHRSAGKKVGSTRKYILSYPETVKRYRLLIERLRLLSGRRRLE
jgi:hypothetical protein